VTFQEIYKAKKTASDREVKYALFDPALVPEGAIGFVHRAAFVGVVVGCSRKSVERDQPGMKVVPIASLRAKEKRWVEMLDNQNRTP
jgi:hypothetical protein